MRIEVEINPAQLAAVQEKLAYLKRGADRALSRALNKTASKARTLASRAIRDQIDLPASTVRDKLKIKKATINQLSSALSAEKRGLLMSNFVTNPGNARRGKPITPIRVKVKANGKSIVLYSAFYVLTKNSNILAPAIDNDVLIRLGMTHSISGSLPYTVLHGPSVSQVFNSVRADISPTLNEYLRESFQRETDWLYTQNPPPPGDGSDDSL